MSHACDYCGTEIEEGNGLSLVEEGYHGKRVEGRYCDRNCLTSAFE